MTGLVSRIAEVLKEHEWDPFGQDEGFGQCACNARWYRPDEHSSHVAGEVVAALALTEERRMDVPGRRGINPVVRFVSEWLPEPPSTGDATPDPATPRRANEAPERPHQIFQRTTWDAPNHSIWCDCGRVFKGETAKEAQEAWQFHKAGGRVLENGDNQ